MSTVVVVRKGRIAVIGADTMAKHGSTKQYASLVVNHSKIFRFGRTFIAMTGSATWELILRDYLKTLKPVPRLDSRDAIFSFATEMHVALKKRYFLNPKEDEHDEFESSQLDCLLANSSGIYGLYALRSVDEFTRYYAFGTGGPYAIGGMHGAYRRMKSARQIARVGIEAAVEFDEDSGAPLELHTIQLH